MLAMYGTNALMRRAIFGGNAYRNFLVGQRELAKVGSGQMQLREKSFWPIQWINARLASEASKCAPTKCGPKKPKSPGLAKIQKLQKQFQKDDGKPIFLKGGTVDNILYRLTWLLCFIGLAGNIGLYLHYIL